MKSCLYCFVALATGCIQALAQPCPLYSDESKKKFQYSGSSWLDCNYQNGRLRSRFRNIDFESTSIDYYSNGIPKEYNLRSKNFSGELYWENKKYNPSGMLIYHMERRGGGKLRFECFHAGGYRLKCHDFVSDVDYDVSVEYVSGYESTIEKKEKK